MARTTTQIETSIDNSETIKLMEYLKDYLTKITNLNTDKLNTLLQDIYNKVNGLTTIIGHLGRPLEPAAADPDIATTDEYSWYFNTTTKTFKMLHNGAWIVIATLTGIVDLSEYLKTTDADAKYASLDLTTANVGAANAGKIIIVNSDGTLNFDTYDQQHHKWVIENENHFVGTFTDKVKHDAFMGITNDVSDNLFENEIHLTTVILPKATTIGATAFRESLLTSLSIPLATTIGRYAFEKSKLTSLDLPKATTINEAAFQFSPLTSLSLPKATTIGRNAFNYSLLTSLSLPEATTIETGAFYHSPLTSLSLPKATTIGAAFHNIVNAPSTTVTMLSKFNDDDEKEDIFGEDNWDQITFTWV